MRKPKKADPNAPAEEKPRRGRPPAKVNGQKIEQLASYGCSVDEIAAVLDVSRDTIDRRFRDELRRGHDSRNGKLRSIQFRLAEEGSAAMAIFLGKNYLGQTDVYRYERLSDEQLLARAREAGIDLGAVGEAAPAAEAAGTSDDPEPN